MAQAYQLPLVTDVVVQSNFWSPAQDRARHKTIPALIARQKEAEYWYCLTWKEGHKVMEPYWESDIYKTIEAACYSLTTEPDEAIMAEIEAAVDMIRAAQHPDGYIGAYYTVTGLSERWTNLRDMHELYNLGHLVEATVAYEMLTNSGRLLEPVTKAVEHVDSMFGREPGKQRGYPGHQEIEIGLLRLYELYRNPLFFKVAKYFLAERGHRDENDHTYFDHEALRRGGNPYSNLFFEMKAWYQFPRDYGYNQADVTFIDATEIKGHAVRAMYNLTAATDLFRLEGDPKVKATIDRLWRDMVDRKMYVTGSLGAVRQWEGFGPAYFLYDTQKEGFNYTETCACFAMIIWCQRLLRIELRSEYADIMELVRSPWLYCACCPPNVAKLLGLLGTLIYSFTPKLVAIHLYIESSFAVPGTNIIVTQKTHMPWKGDVTITVQGTTGLALRIPNWADSYTCSVGGHVEEGYLYIDPSPDMEIRCEFTLSARKVYTNPKTNKDEVCVTRGPLVYCLEGIDHDIDVDEVVLAADPLKEGEAEQLAGVDSVVPIYASGVSIVNKGSALYRTEPWQYSTEKKRLKYIPFFLRANRGGDGGMRVWTKYLSH